MIVITDGTRANNCLFLKTDDSRALNKAMSFRSAAGAEEPAFAGGADTAGGQQFLFGFADSE